jgi:hypothetical protein
MTFEHKIVVGVDDIKAVIVECKCGIRVSFPPDKVSIPENCPAPDCGIAWGKKSDSVSIEREVWASANLNFVDAIGQMRKHLNNSAFFWNSKLRPSIERNHGGQTEARE